MGAEALYDRYAHVIEASPMGMHIYRLLDDDRLEFVGANPAADQLLGVDNALFVGKSIEEAFPPLAQTEVPTRYRAAARDGLSWRTEQIAYEDGQISGAFEVSAFQTAPREMVAMFWNITERKQMEEQLVRSEANVHKLQSFLSNIINSMPSMLVGVDLEGSITQWNRFAEQETCITASDAIGKKLSDVLPRFSADWEGIRDTIARREVYSQPRILWPRDNESAWGDLTAFPLTQNGVVGGVIRFDDVTERVRMEELLIQSEKMLSVGGLAAGMAHEINNPLAGILQSIQVIRNRLLDPLSRNQQSAEASGITMDCLLQYLESRGIVSLLNNVQESALRASHIVSNMLSFSRISSAQAHSCDIRELIDRTIELAANDYDLKNRYDFKKIAIVREYAPEIPLVVCESGKIQQVVLNILNNGAHAMYEKRYSPEERPTFVIRVFEMADQIVMEFSDNGKGMEEAVRRRAFEPFFTTRDTGHGTGLGLSVSYFIITENHGGQIHIDSTPAIGTTFRITLPLKAASAIG